MKSASMFGEINIQIIQYRVKIYYIGSLQDFVIEEGWRQAQEWKTECCQTSFDAKTFNERHCKLLNKSARRLEEKIGAPRSLTHKASRNLHFRAYRLKILQEIKTQEFWKADSL